MLPPWVFGPKLLCTREALIWRTEEFARTACDALERDDLTAAALLARGTVESAALAWRLMEVLGDRQKLSPQKLSEILVRMLAGSRLWPDMPEALQILSWIDRLDKAVRGVRKGYDMLNEIGHPNWRGVFGMYAKKPGGIHGALWSRSAINRRNEERNGQRTAWSPCAV
jgi:hypothetical protein